MLKMSLLTSKLCVKVVLLNENVDCYMRCWISMTHFTPQFFFGGGDLLGLKFMQSSDNKSAMLVDGIHLKNVSR